MGFWKNVEVELDYQGISRKELAFKINSKEITIHKAIERDSEVSALTAFAVAEVLNVQIEKLLDIKMPNFTDSKSTKLNELFFYKKYHDLINRIEALSPEKKKIVLNMNKSLLTDLEKI